MIYLRFAEVAAINERQTGQRLIRDAGAIESACGRPQATVFGDDAYPTVWEKAAALLQSLARNHGFIDGNKRTAWVAAMAFLDVNGHPLNLGFDQDEAEALVISVATGQTEDIPAIASALVKFTA